MTCSDRASLVAHARRRIAKGSRSFRLASQLFDVETRERVWLLYSWCRACDDLSDGQALGGPAAEVSDPLAVNRKIRALSQAAMQRLPTGHPAFDGLGTVVAECGIPEKFVLQHLEGFELDARDWQPADLGELLRYCYHVAGVVGCMMAIVMGVSAEEDDVLDRAADLGIAFQLSNIARDVRDDHGIGRCYLPLDWLRSRGVAPGEVMDVRHRKDIAQITAALTDMAGYYERSARAGLDSLPFRSRWAILAAAAIYGSIGREVARLGVHAWDRRVTIGLLTKLRLVMSARKEARLLPPVFCDRWNLWTRAR